jgi:hypothetical protein
MNTAHLHLMLNHIPVLGTLIGLALLSFALWKRSEESKRIALGLLVTTALLAVPAFLTGEPAEGMVKGLPGVSKAIIEQHEEAAQGAFIGLCILGSVALAGLVWFRGGQRMPSWFGSVVLAGSLLVGGWMAWTANLGGQIRHSEIRSGGDAQADAAVPRSH